MKKTSSADNRELLQQLVMEVMSHHSFEYPTLEEAKQTVHVGDVECCFDALSLRLYSCNLSPDLIDEFKLLLWRHYNAHYDSKAQKERAERESLLLYLTAGSCPYKEHHIIKLEHPDFVLEGNGQKIGVEVVALTTPYDQVLYSIAREHHGQGKTADEIRASAKKKHGQKALNYDYLAINGSACIATKLKSPRQEQGRFAEQLRDKYYKYEADLSSFDKFIVLGDAQRVGGITISAEEDVYNIFDWLREDPEIKGVSFIILWQGDKGSGYAVAQYDS